MTRTTNATGTGSGTEHGPTTPAQGVARQDRGLIASASRWAALIGLGLGLATGPAPGVAPAEAADLKGAPRKVKEPPPPPPVYRTVPLWQGLYGGLGLGYAWGTSEQEYDRNDNHGLASTSPQGWAGNVTLGYNWRQGPSLVLGIEGDLGLMDVRADDKIVYDGHVYKTQFGPLWGTVRGRLGYAFDRFLIYATAGVAFMDVDEVSLGNTPGETATNRSFRTGWTAGAGVEYALTDALSAKLEYLYMDFGRYNGLSANQETFYFDNSVSLIRTGLNLRF